MVGMLQIITYMLAFYFVLKGVEILQIGMASSRSDRKPLIIVGVVAIAVCVLAAWTFIDMQDKQAAHVGTPSVPSMPF